MLAYFHINIYIAPQHPQNFSFKKYQALKWTFISVYISLIMVFVLSYPNSVVLYVSDS